MRDEALFRVATRASTVCDLFDHQFRTRPHATAVRTVDRTWTYNEFDRATRRLAQRLRRRGVGCDTVVALSARRSPAALIGIVGILRSGAACLPLDPDDPPGRNQEVLGDVGARIMLADKPTDWHPDAMLLGRGDDWDEDAPLPAPAPLNLAYAITTSGSTGRPKAVGVPHRGICNLIVASIVDLDLVRAEDVLLWTLSPTVDSSLHDSLMALCCGACVAIPARHDIATGALVSDVRALRSTVLEVPSAVLGPYGRSLLPRLSAAGVRLVITGGSQLDGPGLAAPGAPVVWNGYGPTEISVAATWYRCTANSPRRVPIGQAIRRVSTYVLDRNLTPVADGVEGELYIGGVGVARGYLGLSARTATRFVADPFGTATGQRMYATGDRVRRLPGGDLEFLGRIDNQVKVSGFRVEIDEVEQAVRECDGVVDAAVLLRDDAPGGTPALVAFLVGTQSPDAIVVDRLRERLPGTMIPRFYVWLDGMPLNRAGKIDRRALVTAPITLAAHRKPVRGGRR